jgi:hypothetical protein
LSLERFSSPSRSYLVALDCSRGGTQPGYSIACRCQLPAVRLLSEATWSPSTGGLKIRRWRQSARPHAELSSALRRSGTAKPLPGLRATATPGRAIMTLPRIQAGGPIPKGRSGRTAAIGDRRPRCIRIIRRRRYPGSSSPPTIRRRRYPGSRSRPTIGRGPRGPRPLMWNRVGGDLGSPQRRRCMVPGEQASQDGMSQ